LLVTKGVALKGGLNPARAQTSRSPLVSLKEQLDSRSAVADGLGLGDSSAIAEGVAIPDVAGLAFFDEDVQAAALATRHSALTRQSAEHPRIVMRHCSVRRRPTGAIAIVSLSRRHPLRPPAWCRTALLRADQVFFQLIARERPSFLISAQDFDHDGEQ
jgi:hypothetical protein